MLTDSKVYNSQTFFCTKINKNSIQMFGSNTAKAFLVVDAKLKNVFDYHTYIIILYYIITIVFT